MGLTIRRETFVAVLALAFISGPSRSEAGGPPATSYLTNVELMQSVARGAITRGIAEAPEFDTKLIGVRPIQPSEVDWIVETEILAALSHRGVTVRSKDAQVTAAAPRRTESKNAAKKPVLDFPVDVPPEFVGGDPIPYPATACQSGTAGRVDVSLVINEQGSVANVVVDKSTGEPFESAVQAGVEKYRFKPAQKDKEATPGVYQLRFDFPVVEEGCENATSVGAPPSAATDEEDGEKEEEKDESGAPPATSLSVADEAPLTLAYRVSEAELRYPRTTRRFWIGRKRVERYARIRIDLRLRRGEDVLWADSVEQYASDEVPKSALRYVENDQYAFAKPELPRGGVSRFAEPLVVAGVIGGLVLLFYANQTGN